jgi:protein-S-isoprenylcysteine O-methyltransferase Ste14
MRLIWFAFLPIPIPIVFIMIVNLIANSIALECDEREIPYKIKPTYLSGVTTGIVSCLNFWPQLVYTGIATIIFFIIYMVEIVQWEKILNNRQQPKYNINKY